jgi:hypothetical protein
MNSKNLSRVEPKSLLSFFHFLPLFFFLIFFINLAPLISFLTSSLRPLIPFSSPSPSISAASFDYYNFILTKFLQFFNYSSICLSICLCVNNSNTSYLFFFTLFTTGIKNRSETKRAHDAAISKYKNIFMLDNLLSLLYSII